MPISVIPFYKQALPFAVDWLIGASDLNHAFLTKADAFALIDEFTVDWCCTWRTSNHVKNQPLAPHRLHI